MYNNYVRTIQVTCRAKKVYAGYRCPVFSFGAVTALCAPCCVEGFIKVEKGDVLTVTRWERKWVYGDKQLSKGRSLLFTVEPLNVDSLKCKTSIIQDTFLCPISILYVLFHP